MLVSVNENYGPAKRGLAYNVIKSGSDWSLLRVQGKPLYVPKNLTKVYEGRKQDEELFDEDMEYIIDFYEE